MASDRTRSLGCKGVKFGVGEEMKGWPAHAPYQAILVSAAADRVPDPLVGQLADGGRLVITIGRGPEQTLNCMRKIGGKLRVEAVIPLRMSASVTRPRAR
jgi:protein-L-isoaspartate(D-aspartate) O-methyltransferase